MIEFTCPSCGLQLRVSDKLANKTGKCKRCGEPLKVPSVGKKEVVPPVDKKEVVPELLVDRRRKVMKFALISVPVFVIAIISLIWFGNRNPGDKRVDTPDGRNEQQAKDEYKKGVDFYDKSDYDTAILCFNEAILLNPDYQDAYAKRGTTYWKKNNYSRAISDLSQAIRLDSGGSTFLDKLSRKSMYLIRANAYSLNGDFDESINDYNRLIEMFPDEAGWYTSRGFVYYKKGDHDKWKADLKRGKELTNKPGQ